MYSLILERSSGTWLELIDGLSYPTRVFYTATGYPTKYCVLEILSNILYHIEYPSGCTRVSVGYLTFFIAYLVYSTSRYTALVPPPSSNNSARLATRVTRGWRPY